MMQGDMSMMGGGMHHPMMMQGHAAMMQNQMMQGGMGMQNMAQNPMQGMNGMHNMMQGDNAASEGLNNAVAAAAAVGLAGKTAMNAIGDSLRAVGFGGGFRCHAGGSSGLIELSPFGGTGVGRQGPGTLGKAFGMGAGGDMYTGAVGAGGGGGGEGLGMNTVHTVGRAVNRALDRNINYAADQATNKLIWRMWR
jgi:hypothetical protein